VSAYRDEETELQRQLIKVIQLRYRAGFSLGTLSLTAPRRLGQDPPWEAPVSLTAARRLGRTLPGKPQSNCGPLLGEDSPWEAPV